MAYSSKVGLEFRFLPPRATHFGGLWEAAVKSMKTLLVKNMAQTNLTYVELQTLLIEVEAILNSRPLCAVQTMPQDGEALTSGHMLIGNSLLALPDQYFDLEKMSVSHLSRYQRVTYLKNQFWQMWVRDFVLDLQQKVKWCKPQANIKVGQIVLIHDMNFPPQQRLIGKNC